MAYSDKVLDHYSNPRNVGSMDKNSNEVGTGLVGAPECGDVMKLQIKVNPQTNIIEDAKFKTFGCGSAIASSSLATEWVKGKTVDEALQIKNTEIVKELALPPVKIHCSVLAEDAIRAAIHDWKKKQEAAKPVTSAVAASLPSCWKNLDHLWLRCGRNDEDRARPRACQGHGQSPGQGADGHRQGRHLARAGRVAPGRAGRRMFGPELQHSLRHAAAGARPDLPVRRCACVCGSEIVHLSERHDPGLSGDADAAGIRVRQSECIEVMRLRYVILRVMCACVAAGDSPAKAWSGKALRDPP